MTKGNDQGLSLSEGERECSSKPLSVKVRRRLRRCASLDNYNPWYERLLEERRGLTAKNFVKANMVCIKRVYDVHVCVFMWYTEAHAITTPPCPPHAAVCTQPETTSWGAKTPLCGRRGEGKAVPGGGTQVSHNSLHTHTVGLTGIEHVVNMAHYVCLYVRMYDVVPRSLCTYVGQPSPAALAGTLPPTQRPSVQLQLSKAQLDRAS